MNASNHTTAQDDNLTLSRLKEVLHEMERPKPPQPVMFVVTPRTKARLEKVVPTTTLPGIQFPLGIPVCVKENQKRDCWAFSDMKMARQYLNEEISEAYLEAFLAAQITP